MADLAIDRSSTIFYATKANDDLDFLILIQHKI